MSNNGEFPPGYLCWLKEGAKYFEPKRKTLFWNLVPGIRICRFVHAGDHELLADPAARQLLVMMAKKFQHIVNAALAEATVTGNSKFLTAFSKALEAVDKGKEDLFKKYSIQLQALLVYEEMWRELGHPPNDDEVLGRLGQILGLDLTAKSYRRQRLRVRQALAALKLGQFDNPKNARWIH